jgi:hypothetical protein
MQFGFFKHDEATMTSIIEPTPILVMILDSTWDFCGHYGQTNHHYKEFCPFQPIHL